MEAWEKDMEIHQLVYFVAVAETGGFSRAAERCNVAQPSLSQQIMKLEHELGQQLFDRLGRTVTLTQAGQALLPRARSILAELQEIKRGLSQEINEGYGHLAVGFIPTVAPFVLPGVVKLFTNKFPHAELSVYEDLTEALLRNLLGGKLDIAIMSLPLNNKLIITHELCTEPLLVASARHHELISKASIRVKELEGFPFIALNEVHCLGEQVQSFCYQQNLNLQIVCHTSQLSTVQSCIALGLGVSLVPQMLAASDTSGQIVYRPVSDAMPRRKIAAASHAGRLLSFLAQQFIEVVQDECNRLVERPGD
jgi:LysR family hydrogen peroxide-inducible transcriptional activator